MAHTSHCKKCTRIMWIRVDPKEKISSDALEAFNNDYCQECITRNCFRELYDPLGKFLKPAIDEQLKPTTTEQPLQSVGYVLGPKTFIGKCERTDVKIEPSLEPIPLFTCTVLMPGDPYPEPTGNMNDSDYVGVEEIPTSETQICVLQFLNGKPMNNLAWNWILSLRPSILEVVPYGVGVHMDCRLWRVRVHLNKAGNIGSIRQEVRVGTVGVHNGHDLEKATFDINYKQETHVSSFLVNKKALEKLTLDEGD
jgi:hypothetical protein